MGIRVKATKRGYRKRLIEPGEEFEIEKTSDLGSWMEPISKKAFEAAKKKELRESAKAVEKKDDDGDDDDGPGESGSQPE